MIGIVLLCAVVVILQIKCLRLKQALAKAKVETARFDQLWREAWGEWMKTQDRLRKAHADRTVWRDKWKAGAFEMDAATMGRLAEPSPSYEPKGNGRYDAEHRERGDT
jgi:hypothetical protein